MNYKFDGDKVFFTSDTHFNHTNIIQFCQRPFKSTDEMNEAMITNWNNIVGEDDTVFHLGDFCVAKLRNFCEIFGCEVKKVGHSQWLYRKFFVTLHIKNLNYQH